MWSSTTCSAAWRPYTAGWPEVRGRVELDALFAGLAQTLANATLRLDRAGRERLAELEGSTVQVESAFPAQVWSWRVTEGRMEVLAGLADSPDAVVRGNAQDLFAWFVAPDSRAAEKVEIQGDATLLAELAEVFRVLTPFGMASPVGAQDLLGAAELAGAVLRSAAESVAGAWRDATTERFVDRARFDDFASGIATLRDAVGRLSERVRALEPGGSGGSGTQGESMPGGKPAGADAARDDAAPGKREQGPP